MKPHTLPDDPYYQEDIDLFTGTFSYFRNNNKPRPVQVRAKIHTSQEQYTYGSLQDEIVPLTRGRGTRTYLYIHPYVEEPNIILTVGIPQNGYADTDAIGTVQSTHVEGFRHTNIGNVQAWYYPTDHILVLWECFLERFVRGTSLLTDENMRQLWQQIELHLLHTFQGVRRIVTPFSDPLFETKEYQTFLHTVGYRKVPTRPVYGKNP